MISRGRLSIGVILLGTLVMDACIDRVNLDFPQQVYPVVIDGFISDQPPPYEVTVSKTFDIQSKTSLREPLAVKQLILSDDIGTQEELIEVRHGIYQTNGHIRGKVGRVYKLYIRLLDGREYESTPDTLHPSGYMDSVYFQFRADRTQHQTTEYGFDIFFNARSSGEENARFLWKFVGTYKTTIACCTCWPYLYNPMAIVSDGHLIQEGGFVRIKAAYLPITGWTFMYKVHAAVSQMSLSRNAFKFWSAIKSQQEAVGSLFQPVTGRIPNNFVQVSGNTGEIYGLFYATSVTSKAVYITRRDVPNPNYIPEIQLVPNHPDPPKKCIDQFPGSSSEMPPYWLD